MPVKAVVDPNTRILLQSLSCTEKLNGSDLLLHEVSNAIDAHYFCIFSSMLT